MAKRRKPKRRRLNDRRPDKTDKLVVSNVVCTAQLEPVYPSTEIPNMNQLSDMFYGQFDKMKFAAACRIRLNFPYCTVLVFNIGKVVVTAVRSMADAIECFHAIIVCLLRSGFFVEFSNITVVNYASTYYLSHMLDMPRVQVRYPQMNWWEENFAGGSLRIPIHHGASALLFKTGRLVITGAKQLEQLQTSVAWLRDNLVFQTLIEDY